MQISRMNTQTGASGANLVYEYKPSIMGAPSQFKLTGEGLEWSVGRGSGLVPYGDIRRVRMSFRPAHMQSQRYITTVWADGAPKQDNARKRLVKICESFPEFQTRH